MYAFWAWHRASAQGTNASGSRTWTQNVPGGRCDCPWDTFSAHFLHHPCCVLPRVSVVIPPASHTTVPSSSPWLGSSQDGMQLFGLNQHVLWGSSGACQGDIPRSPWEITWRIKQISGILLILMRSIFGDRRRDRWGLEVGLGWSPSFLLLFRFISKAE